MVVGEAVGGCCDWEAIGQVSLLLFLLLLLLVLLRVVITGSSVVGLPLVSGAVNQTEDLAHEGGAQVQGEGGERAREGEGVHVAARARDGERQSGEVGQ